jgi:molybdopterin molybdotransferase
LLILANREIGNLLERQRLDIAADPLLLRQIGCGEPLASQRPHLLALVPAGHLAVAAQVRIAGGEPVVLGNAADRVEDLGEKIEQGLKEDALVLTGGVSMGKYDLVESVLKALGAEFFFDAVAIRPGKPAVFAICQGKPAFGLPGNPVSTMVTFQLFVTPAIDLLCGAEANPLPLVEARLALALNERAGLTHFLPARIEWHGAEPQVSALKWQGSGDIAALAGANCFLVVPAEREKIASGERVSVLLRKDVV